MTWKRNTTGNIKGYDYNAKGYDQNSDVQYKEGKAIIPYALKKAADIVRKNNLKEFKVLDVGCGNGRTTIDLYVALRKALVDVYSEIEVYITGIDISSNMIKFADVNAEIEGITNEHIVFINKSIEELSEEDGYYDMVFSNCSMHLCTPHAYIKLIDRLNIDGAVVVNQGCNRNNMNIVKIAERVTGEEEFAKYFTNWKVPFFYPSKEELRDILFNAGYENIKIEEEEYKDNNYEYMIKIYADASLKVFLEQLPDDGLKKQFEQKFIEFSKEETDKYKHVHRLHITADKLKWPDDDVVTI